MSKKSRLKPYHYAWLACHPGRTEEWLLDRLADGFHVHHADENHDNNSPNNLCLVEGLDHMLVFHAWKLHWVNTGKKLEPNTNPFALLASKGGLAAAKSLTKRQRKQRATHAARKRWAKQSTLAPA